METRHLSCVDVLESTTTQYFFFVFIGDVAVMYFFVYACSEYTLYGRDHSFEGWCHCFDKNGLIKACLIGGISPSECA